MGTEASRHGRWVRRFRGGPPPLLILALLCGVAVQHFFSARFPSTADGKLHLYRLVEFDHALRHGVLLPRWSPDLVYGYGFPLFNYYAPLPYYLGAAFHLAGISYQLATQATFVALIVLAAWATYRWLDGLFGPVAGLLGAIAYVYAPYLGHTGVRRGALGEVTGLALMPLVLWAFTRLTNEVSRGRFALAALSLGALLLAHNLTALLFAPVLLAGLLVLWLAGGRAGRQGAVLAGAAALGLALGAIFWLPAFAERDLVQIGRLFGPAAFDFHLHFISLDTLLTPPTPFDPRQLAQPFLPALGLPQVALALVGLWVLFRGPVPPRERALVGAALVGAMALSALTLPLSTPLWEAIPLLRFVQFPWRLLGPASLLLALVVGASTSAFDALPARLRGLALAVAALAMAIYGMWWLFGHYEPPLVAETVQDVQRFEVENDAAGTTSFVDYLPVTVAQLPPADGLAGRYAKSNVIARLSTEGLPDGAEIISQGAGLTWARATVDSPTPFTATWDWFAFPGWRASLDGEPVAITPGDPYGLMQVAVPAGRHEIAIRFGPTSVRLAAGLISLAALLVLLAVAWRLPAPAGTAGARPPLAWRDVWPVAAGMLVLLVVKVGYLNRAETIFQRSRYDGQMMRGIDGPTRALFEDQIVYLGYDRGADTVAAGETLEITFYWAAQGPLAVDYSTSAVLTDAEGNNLAQADSQHPGGWPTSRWEGYEYAADTHVLSIPPETPPGVYTLQTSVYATPGGVPQPLDVLDVMGNPAGTLLPVMDVEVRQPDSGGLDAAHPLAAARRGHH